MHAYLQRRPIYEGGLQAVHQIVDFKDGWRTSSWELVRLFNSQPAY